MSTSKKKKWTKIHNRIQKILRNRINKRPELFLLGIDMRQIDETDRTLVWYMLLAARTRYAKYWKLKKIPKMSKWLEKLLFFAEMEKITKKLREQNDEKFQKDWIKFKKYINKKWKGKNLIIIIFGSVFVLLYFIFRNVFFCFFSYY